MSQTTKPFLILSILILIFGFGLTALAQEEPATDVAEDVALDEDVKPEDLDIKEPKLLPDSPFYFLKNWGREIKYFFSFSRTAKLELREKIVNERLVELEKLIEEGENSEIIEKTIEKYQKELEKIKKISEKIKQKAQDNPKLDKFLDKFTKHQALHQRILEKLEEQVPAEVFAKIKEARERHLEKFGEVMTKLEDKEKIQAKIENNLREIKGSKYKNFRNLEVLLKLEEKVPERAKEAIQRAQENALKRLKGDLEKMSPEDQEKFKLYLEKISGDKETQLEILENLKAEIKDKPELWEKLFEARTRILERARETVSQITCPKIEKPAVDFCKEGRIVVKKNGRGCIASFDCLIPGEIELPTTTTTPGQINLCIQLWDPVCGKDGKTYSNSCFARVAGVEVAYKGACRLKECQTDADCPQLKCGPAGVKCIGVKSKCVEGKCQVQSIEKP